MQPTPPPGWYPDPSDQRRQRWWDGNQWGPQAPTYQPPAAATVTAIPSTPWTNPSPSGQQQTVTQGRAPFPWAWGVAAMPVIQLAAGVVVGLAGGMPLGGPGAVLIGVLVATVLGIWMAVRDARTLRAAGESFSSGLAAWCLIAGWVYLLARAIKRVRRTNKDWGLFAASLIVWLVVIVIEASVINSAVVSGSVFNRSKVQTDVAQAIQAKTGVSVTVDCPQNPSLTPGSQFQCVATGNDGSTAMVTITIQDSSGDYTWQVTG